jgi:hypothetical protein
LEGSCLFIQGAAFGDAGQLFFAFKHFFVDVEAAVACAKLSDVGVAVVAGADYVSVVLQFA